MKQFTVVWNTEIQGHLADIWMVHPDRNAVTSAVHEIDSVLAEDPMGQGGELSEGIRFFLLHR